MKSKKAISLLLTLCMALAMFPASAVAAENFSDVSENDWYYDAVMFCRENDLMRGLSDDVFDPYGTVTRAMAATVIYRMLGEHKADNFWNRFTDVPDGEWYTDAIKWMTYNTLIVGYGDGLFGPNDPVTREQMATMIFRGGLSTGYLPEATGNDRPFNDVESTSDWAYPAVIRLNGLGILEDLPGDSFRPQSVATRAEIASMLYRYTTLMDGLYGPGGYEGYYGEDFEDEPEYWFEEAVVYFLYNCEHSAFYLAQGMKPMIVGTSETINDEVCWKVFLGRENGDRFDMIQLYAVGLDSRQVYRYDSGSEQWFLADEWNLDEG